MNSAPQCPLCNQPVERCVGPDQYFNILYICKRCGRFGVHIDTTINEDEKHLLSAACRRWNKAELPVIAGVNIHYLLSSVPRFTVAEQMDELLQLIAGKTKSMGAPSSLSLKLDYPLLVAKGEGEAQFLAEALVERGLVSKQHYGFSGELRLTATGWERREQTRQAGRTSSLVFVAMWFDESTNKLYSEAIAPAIRDARYEPVRIDQHEHVNSIDDEIIGQMRRSRFMVADFTEQRQGVYFEAGFMLGLGRNVVWMCPPDELNKVHFDVRQRNFIVWKSLPDARDQLYKRILAIEDEGPRT